MGSFVTIMFQSMAPMQVALTTIFLLTIGQPRKSMSAECIGSGFHQEVTMS
jgi:hypothetical protein